MTTTLPPLEDLRRAIDAVDDGLLDLVIRRGELVEAVGRTKSRGDAPVYRPAREAQIMRRLLARAADPAEKDRILGIWRAIMAASYERQGGLRLVAEPAAEWPAISHFAPRQRPPSAPPRDALAKVLAGAADLAIIAPPRPAEGAWLASLVEARASGAAVFVLGRLPFYAARADAAEALVLGKGVADPSGDDVTLVAAPASAPPRGAVPLGADVGVKGLSLFAHAEYVRPDDPRLGAASAVWLGAYPRPLDQNGPRTVEFAQRP